MTAQTLRDAAKVLRERAEAATPGPWGDPGDVQYGAFGWSVYGSPAGETEDSEAGRADAGYIATMHPGVGLALARWLEDIAAGWMWDEDPEDVETPDGWPLTLEESMDMHALAVARAILGEPA